MKRNSFAYRHIGPKAAETSEMLQVVGAESLDALIDQTVPNTIRFRGEMDLSEPMTEAEFAAHIGELGQKNSIYTT